jgi:hypothetical protein
LRYSEARRIERSRILDELVAVTGCHRKHAMRVLRVGLPVRAMDRGVYGLLIPAKAHRSKVAAETPVSTWHHSSKANKNDEGGHAEMAPRRDVVTLLIASLRGDGCTDMRRSR